MRTGMITLIAIGTALAASVEPSSAQNRRFCTQHPIGHGGFPYCGFDTFDQCRATASGTGAYCISNPWYEEPAKKPARKKRVRRQ
jgi:hypothetical protein